MTPTSGPAGTVITVSGGECGSGDPEGPEATAEFGLLWVGSEIPVIVAVEQAVPGADGSWTGQITVPEGVDPDDEYAVSGVCYLESPEGDPEIVAEYDYFDVTGDQPTTPPPTVDPPVVLPEAPTAPPAVAVVAQPDFAG